MRSWFIVAMYCAIVALTLYINSGLMPVFTQDGEPVGPVIQLEAPRKCKAGDLVVFDARASKVGGDLLWAIVPETGNFVVADNTKRAFFSHYGAGEFLIIISGASGDVPLQHIHRITVKGGAGGGGVAGLVSIWFRDVPKYEGRDRDTVKLSQVFLTLAQTDIPPAQMLAAAVKANTEALGSNLDHWKLFLDKLGAYVDLQVADGKLKTVSDYRSLWTSIGRALDAVL